MLYHGDCLAVLKTFPDNSVDSVVTDPPYGLGKQPDALQMLSDWLDSGHHDVNGKGFMNKEWDAFIPQPALWKEVFRVLKPGGHILCFAGTRTQDLMGLSLRLAGFEIRDCVYWVYGSGFPKSLNISKQIISTAIDEAKQWNGWGSALKPSVEPCIMARKPINGTITNNILKYGTGGLNIDGCRVETDEDIPVMRSTGGRKFEQAHTQPNRKLEKVGVQTLGRWPANLIHDGSDEVIELFPDTKGSSNQGFCNTTARSWKNSSIAGINRVGYEDSGSAARFFYCAKASKRDRDEGLEELEKKPLTYSNGAQAASSSGSDEYTGGSQNIGLNNIKQRHNNHPTVKPTKLMQYLCRLITPPNGTVLDPFMGSGSTGKAAKLEGFNFIGIEKEEDYFNIAKIRINNVTSDDGDEEEIEQNDKKELDITDFLD